MYHAEMNKQLISNKHKTSKKKVAVLENHINACLTTKRWVFMVYLCDKLLLIPVYKKQENMQLSKRSYD